MRCPHCMHEGNPAQGKCLRCGYTLTLTESSSRASRGSVTESSSRALRGSVVRSTVSGQLSQRYQPMRGDLLGGGRYRLMTLIDLPEDQRQHGTAWSALDIMASHRRVMVREIRVPEKIARAYSTEVAAARVAQRFKDLGEHPGFPKVADYFNEKGSSFLVLLYPEGETLAAVLQRQAGALPEYLVASYGYQVCTLLATLADQQPPLVHGAISPDTIVLSEDGQSASLIHLPLFQLEPRASNAAEQAPAGYAAPEQVRGGEITPSCDLYSLAVTMHQAVTGYDPHTRLALFHPPARRLNPAVTPRMEMILARQFSLSPSQRYGHPSEMQKELAELLESYPDPVSDEHPIVTPDLFSLSTTQLREQSKSATMLNIGVFAAICAFLLLGLILLLLRSF
jgi:serine/threonine protein kinase